MLLTVYRHCQSSITVFRQMAICAHLHPPCSNVNVTFNRQTVTTLPLVPVVARPNYTYTHLRLCKNVFFGLGRSPANLYTSANYHWRKPKGSSSSSREAPQDSGPDLVTLEVQGDGFSLLGKESHKQKEKNGNCKSFNSRTQWPKRKDSMMYKSRKYDSMKGRSIQGEYEGKIQQNQRFSKENVEVQGEIVFGTFPVLLALRAARRHIHSLYMKQSLLDTRHDRPHVEQILSLTKQLGVEVHATQLRTLNWLSGGRPHQGLCMDTDHLQLPCYTQISHMWHDGKDKKRPELWVVLESIHDPMNFGAIIRSSYFLGVDRLFTVKGGSCPPTPVVSKASAGALELAPIYTIDSVPHFIKEKKSEGWSVLGTVGAIQYPDVRTCSLSTTRLQENTVLIMGNEGEGLSAESELLCDLLITIEAGRLLVPNVESLNVSVASGIILHHLLSSRNLD